MTGLDLPTGVDSC